MQFKNIIVALFAGTVTAVAVPPGGGSGGDYEPCPSLLYSTALCCATDVGGVLGLDCKNVPKSPVSATDFKSVCANVVGGQQPACCTLPLLGQAVLCQRPVGV